jgi:hypothetical protein
MTLAVFNEKIIIDEIAFEAPSSPFARYFLEMKGYYRDRLCDLRREMRARHMGAPNCQDFSVIPKKLTQNLGDRSRRHNRDYFIIRDSQKIFRGYALLFARVYSVTAKTAQRRDSSPKNPQ